MNKRIKCMLLCVLAAVSIGNVETHEARGVEVSVRYQEREMVSVLSSDVEEEPDFSREIFNASSSTAIESYSTQVKNVSYGDVQKLVVKMKDGTGSYDSFWLTLSNEKGQELTFRLRQSEPNIFTSEFLVGFQYSPGVYKVTQYSLSGTRNGASYSESFELPYASVTHPLSKASFTSVKRNDIVGTLSMSNTVSKIGDEAVVTLVFNTHEIFDYEISLSFANISKNGRMNIPVKLERIGKDTFRGVLKIEPGMMTGSLTLSQISFVNHTVYVEEGAPFTLKSSIKPMAITVGSGSASSNKVKKTTLVTPTINVGQDLKVRVEFEKPLELYEVETRYQFSPSSQYQIEEVSVTKISSVLYELTIPSHRLRLMEFHDVYNYPIILLLKGKGGEWLWSEPVTATIRRNGSRMYSIGKSSVIKNEISIDEDSTVLIKHAKDVGVVGAINMVFTGNLTNNVKTLTLGPKDVDPVLSDSTHYVYKGKLAIEPYERDTLWSAYYYETFFDTGFHLIQAEYGFISWGLQVITENLSHLDLSVVKGGENAVERIKGENRYASAVKISQESFTKADTAILVAGTNFPDALAAGPLAIKVDAPILLTQKDRISTVTLNELKRLQVKKVIILGGEGVVSAEVAKVLSGMNIVVERIAGSSRFKTSLDVAERFAAGGNVEKVILTNGYAYADSLAVGSYAAKEGLPILLTRTETLRPEVKTFLSENGTKEVIVMGGSSAISSSVEMELKEMGLTVTRVSGANRYLTAMESAKKFYPDAKTMVIASGEDFADALAAVPYAAKKNLPVILSRKSSISQTVLSYLDASGVRAYTFIGGTGALDGRTEYAIRYSRYE